MSRSKPTQRRNNQPSGKQNQGQARKPVKKQKQEDREPLLPRLNNSTEVPVMFRAQIQKAHGSLQFAGKVIEALWE